MKKAIILFEDGHVFEGSGFGAQGTICGEVVFNTSMMGYQEILTDPSYKGQIVCMTYPLIGNYGITSSDIESSKLQIEGFVVKEQSRISSNWRSKEPLGRYLEKNNIIAIEGVDTRAITKRLREKGSMKAIISTKSFDLKGLKQKLDATPSIVGRDLVCKVSCKKPYEWTQDLGLRKMANICQESYTVVVIDCGVKLSILRNLKERFKKIIVVPAKTSLKEILKLKPNGILFSNGPGDPEPIRYVIETAKELIARLKRKQLRVAVMGICLGHQILGLAFGGKAQKLKFGHHGGNHPVKDLKTGKVDITAQNHNFVIPPDTIPEQDLTQTHINLYDHTPEGSEHKKLPIFSVQFHPEAGPGPFDAQYIFDKFITLIERL